MWNRGGINHKGTPPTTYQQTQQNWGALSIKNPSLEIYDDVRFSDRFHCPIPAKQKLCCYCLFLWLKVKAANDKAPITRHATETTVVPKQKQPKKMLYL